MQTNHLPQGLQINRERERPQSTVNVPERVSSDGNVCHSVIHMTLSRVPQVSWSPGLGKGADATDAQDRNTTIFTLSNCKFFFSFISDSLSPVHTQDLLIIYVYECFACTCLCSLHVFLLPTQVRKGCQILRTGLQAVRSYSVVDGNWTWVPRRNSQCSKHLAISLTPVHTLKVLAVLGRLCWLDLY